jgi:hypothetical protein
MTKQWFYLQSNNLQSFVGLLIHRTLAFTRGYNGYNQQNDTKLEFHQPKWVA